MPQGIDPDSRELAVAMQLIDALEAEWDPKAYHDTYRERINALIAEKREGHAIVFEAERPRANVVNLIAALEASVAQSRKGACGCRLGAGRDHPCPVRRQGRAAELRGHEQGGTACPRLRDAGEGAAQDDQTPAREGAHRC